MLSVVKDSVHNGILHPKYSLGSTSVKREHIMIYSNVLLSDWEAIKNIARVFDVENGSSPDHVFDLRENADVLKEYILFWGRDGWRDGYYHGSINLRKQQDGKHYHVYLARGEDSRCMRVFPMRHFLCAIFDAEVSGAF